MSVPVQAPDPKMVDVIDYDIILASGKELQFTLCPVLGDFEHVGTDAIELRIEKTKHHVEIARAQIAVFSRRPRKQVDIDDLVQQFLNPNAKPCLTPEPTS